MISRSIRWLVIIGILVFEGIVNIGIGDVAAASPTGVLKEAIHWSLSADAFDPANAGGGATAHTQLYLFHDTLVKSMPEGLFTPSLAESWTISPDARVYEFKLRKGVKFHNGDLMTGDDVIFSFWRYRASHAKIIHDKTEKVEAVNPYLVRFHFKRPFPDFLEYLVMGTTSIGWVVPKKYVEKVGEAEYKRHPIGAGPYKFVEFMAGTRLVAEAFDGYWRKVPNIKRIELHTILEPGTRMTMVKRGEVDIATFLQGVFYEDAKKDPNLRLLIATATARWFVHPAAQWDPKSPWADPRVRKAASLAIDRKTLADIHMPGSVPVGSLGLTNDPTALQFPPDPYDPERAKKLLAEAGYPKGFHGGKFFFYDGGYWPYSEQVANYWKAIGITTDAILLDRPAFLVHRESGKMKGTLFIEPAVAPTIGGRLLYLFGATSTGNYPDIKASWDNYQLDNSVKVREVLIGNIQKMIHDRAMYLPLTSSTSPAAVGPKIKGDPYKIPYFWVTAPFEDIELNS